MPVPRTADFVAMGRNHAQNAILHADGLQCPRPYKRESKSWQAKAYWSGYDEETERLGKSAILKSVEKRLASVSVVKPRYFINLPALGHRKLVVATMGPLYPPKVKGRSRRPGGWTGAA